MSNKSLRITLYDHRITSHDVIKTQHIRSNHVTSYHIMSWHIMSYHSRTHAYIYIYIYIFFLLALLPALLGIRTGKPENPITQKRKLLSHLLEAISKNRELPNRRFHLPLRNQQLRKVHHNEDSLQTNSVKNQHVKKKNIYIYYQRKFRLRNFRYTNDIPVKLSRVESSRIVSSRVE